VSRSFVPAVRRRLRPVVTPVVEAAGRLPDHVRVAWHQTKRRAAIRARAGRTAVMATASFGSISAGVWDILGRGYGLIALGVFGLVLERLGGPDTR
jgi:hypothetical protein